VQVDANGIAPQAMGALPVQCAAMNRPYVSVAELTIEAARTGNPTLIRQAVLMDPNASSTLTPEQIWELCNDLVAAHGDLLPEPLRELIPADRI
jgi:alpha-galactosidase